MVTPVYLSIPVYITNKFASILTCMSTAMDKIPEDQLNELMDAFALFDKEGKGTLKASEVGDLARAMGTNCTVAEANKISGEQHPPPSN